MIQLGLQRAAQLFKNNPQPWRAIHVAGTNGKGTVCAYISALFHGSGIKCGRFTSPHLIDRWDCITIDEKPVSENIFHRAEAHVKEINQQHDIQATEFEILTATAFEIFTQANVKVAVVEVGMGGRDDATNILKHKDCTVITKIGLDHQAFLGNTIEDIARHKCGIFCKNVPVIYNATNQESVLQVIEAEALKAEVWSKTDATIKSKMMRPVQSKLEHELPQLPGTVWKSFQTQLKDRQQQRIAINSAWKAFRYVRQLIDPEFKPKKADKERSRRAIMGVQWPGRMQRLDVSALVPGAGDILLDGAHNLQAAENLASVVNRELRNEDDTVPISWVIASTKGRDVRDLAAPLINPIDRVATVQFGPVDGMPWVKAQESTDITSTLKGEYQDLEVKSFQTDIKGAIAWAAEVGHPIVVTGSLYLVSDLLRLLRNAGGEITREVQVPQLAKRRIAKDELHESKKQKVDHTPRARVPSPKSNSRLEREAQAQASGPLH